MLRCGGTAMRWWYYILGAKSAAGVCMGSVAVIEMWSAHPKKSHLLACTMLLNAQIQSFTKLALFCIFWKKFRFHVTIKSAQAERAGESISPLYKLTDYLCLGVCVFGFIFTFGQFILGTAGRLSTNWPFVWLNAIVLFLMWKPLQKVLAMIRSNETDAIQPIARAADEALAAFQEKAAAIAAHEEAVAAVAVTPCIGGPTAVRTSSNEMVAVSVAEGVKVAHEEGNASAVVPSSPSSDIGAESVHIAVGVLDSSAGAVEGSPQDADETSSNPTTTSGDMDTTATEANKAPAAGTAPVGPAPPPLNPAEQAALVELLLRKAIAVGQAETQEGTDSLTVLAIMWPLIVWATVMGVAYYGWLVEKQGYWESTHLLALHRPSIYGYVLPNFKAIINWF